MTETVTGAVHTAGPWEVQTPMGENCPWIVPAGKEAYEWEAIATLGDCLEDGPSPRSKAFRTIHADARLIVAACNSYDRHFGPHAVSAAEGDLLGRCLDLLAEAGTTSVRLEYTQGWHEKRRAILSQAQASEVTK